MFCGREALEEQEFAKLFQSSALIFVFAPWHNRSFRAEMCHELKLKNVIVNLHAQF